MSEARFNADRVRTYIAEVDRVGYGANYFLWEVVPMIERVYPHEWLGMDEAEFEDLMALCEDTETATEWVQILRKHFNMTDATERTR